MSASVSPAIATAPSLEGSLSASGARKALAGFFVSGMLLSFPGAILLSWEHHLAGDYAMIGMYFLGLIAGLIAALGIAPGWLERRGVSWTLALGCVMAGASLLYLAFFSPPWSPWFRVVGLACLGAASATIHTAIFHAISPMYRHDPHATVNLAGVLFGLGGFMQALLVSLSFYLYTAPAIQTWLAVVPAAFGWMYRRTRFSSDPVPLQPRMRAIAGGATSPGALLLSLLLLFQLGNEWSVAGWLPLFLSQRLGFSPTTSLGQLALYWLALLIGRVAAQWILPRVRHSLLLLGSVIGSMFACVILMATNNQFGSITGVLLLGATFAPIYPLVVEKIGDRFPNYHPGFYNGVFTLALAGGFLAPAMLGWIGSAWGIGWVMILPLVGSALVFILLILVAIEARFSTHARRYEIA